MPPELTALIALIGAFPNILRAFVAIKAWLAPKQAPNTTVSTGNVIIQTIVIIQS